MKIQADVIKGCLMGLGAIVVLAFLIKMIWSLLPFIIIAAIGVAIWYFFFRGKKNLPPPTSNTP